MLLSIKRHPLNGPGRNGIQEESGAPNENIVQNHLNIALMNVF